MNLEEATKMTKENIKPFALGMGVGAIVELLSSVVYDIRRRSVFQ